MNQYLQNLRQTLVDSATEIVLGGVKYLIKKPTTAQLGKWNVEAEEIAKHDLSERREELMKQPATDSEKADFAAIFGAMKCETAYDYSVQLRKVFQIQRLAYPEMLTDENGAKLYSNPEEREELIDTIFSIDELMTAIGGVMAAPQKKTSGKPLKASGSGPK